MALHPIKTKTGEIQYIISSNQTSIPGIYDSERAAKYAFRFQNVELKKLQDKVNSHEPDYDNRVITFEMLHDLARQLRQAKI